MTLIDDHRIERSFEAGLVVIEAFSDQPRDAILSSLPVTDVSIALLPLLCKVLVSQLANEGWGDVLE